MKRCRLKRSNFQIKKMEIDNNSTFDNNGHGNDFIPDVSCCALLEDLNLKLIAMSCVAQEHFNENDYDVTKMNIDEIRSWIHQKRSRHCS